MGDLPRNSPILKADQAEVAKLIAKRGLVAKPGKRFAYTFRGYAAVARCIEVATGRRFAELLNEKLLKPLGVRVTRIAMGLPVGSDLEDVDDVTMHKAMEGRREL